jgi:hypothetical protein
MKDTEPLRAIIAEQTAEFLAKGGKIKYIPSGETAESSEPRRDFSLSRNRNMGSNSGE